eukprot:4035795-Amphidinium_carterae.1
MGTCTSLCRLGNKAYIPVADLFLIVGNGSIGVSYAGLFADMPAGVATVLYDFCPHIPPLRNWKPPIDRSTGFVSKSFVRHAIIVTHIITQSNANDACEKPPLDKTTQRIPHE